MSGTRLLLLATIFCAAWDMPNLTKAEQGLLQNLLTVPQDAYVISADASPADTNKVLHIIIDFICGNPYYDRLQSGVKATYYQSSVEFMADSKVWSAFSDAGNLYQTNKDLIATAIYTEAGVAQGDSAEEALNKINNWMCSSFTYNSDAFSYSIQQAMETRSGVCGQFSQIFKYACDCLGIPCDLIASPAMCHAYNRVIIDGRQLYVDVTWNITFKNPSGWFLKTEDEIRTDHIIE